MDWSLRACARKGHLTYRPDEAVLRDRLHVDTPAGEAWRCLRCGDFVPGEAVMSGPADEAPLVLRGQALRDATILRLLAAERGIRGVLLLVLAYGVLRFQHSETSLRQTFDRALPAAKPLADVFNYDLDASPTVERIRHLLASRPHTLQLIAIGLLAYAALQLTEAVGLYLLKRWGEYVAAVGTSGFLPLEVYELTHKVTALRLGAFVVNVAAVAYLVLTKRLFGVRGGREAYEEERRSESLLEVTAATRSSAAE
ncbi:MAG: DUF2127 domain-containing protein [Actinomycetota bacterium]|nr:DUF2127 domain-containing protein [Actinomycetota bacterium]